MIPFLIAGIVGSSIFAILSIYTFAMNTGVFDWGFLVLGMILGLLGGSAGYLLFRLGSFVGHRLFKFPKTPPKIIQVVFYVISGILGMVFYIKFYSYIFFAY